MSNATTPPDSRGPLWVSTSEAARRLQLPLRTVQEWCNTGVLPARRSISGKRWLVDIEAAIARHADVCGERPAELASDTLDYF